MSMVNVGGRTINIIKFSGRYMPKVGDVIIGDIIDDNIYSI